MKIKATRTMVKYLNENIEEYEFLLQKLTPEQYAIYVDYDLDSNIIDYSPKTGKFSVITVAYPEEFYAMPQALTTMELNRIFKKSDRTEEGFLAGVENKIAI